MNELLTLARKHWRAILLWIAGALFASALVFLKENPWLLAWLAVPPVLLELHSPTRWLMRRGAPMGRRWKAAFLATVALTVLTILVPATNPQNPLQGYSNVRPENWLGLSRLGDWRYLVAPSHPTTNRLLVFTLPKPESGQTWAQARFEVAQAVAQAADHGAAGIALDLTFGGHDPEVARNLERVDPHLVNAVVTKCRPRDIPVFVGFEFRSVRGELVAVPNPATLVDDTVDPEGTGCFGASDHGHVITFQGWDGVIRAVPLGFLGPRGLWGDRAIPALSARVAASLAGEDPAGPEGDLLYPIPSEPGPTVLPLAEIRANPEVEALIRNRFVLIGEDSDRDRKRVGFADEPIPGVLLHAYAVESLLTGTWFRRPSIWFAVAAAVFPLLSLAGRFSRAPSPLRPHLFSTAAVSLLVIALATLASYFGRLWIPVAPVLIPLWLLFGAALFLRRG